MILNLPLGHFSRTSNASSTSSSVISAQGAWELESLTGGWLGSLAIGPKKKKGTLPQTSQKDH